MATRQNKKDYLNYSDLSAFCAQASMILKSGISITEGMEIMSGENNGPQNIYKDIYEEIEKGSTFHYSLSNTGVLPKYMLDMILIGEQTGKLDDVLDSLSRYYETEDNIVKSLRSAVTYPFVMISMMICVILILIIKVLPVFNEVFKQLGTEMTGFSKNMMKLGVLIGSYANVFIVTVSVLLVLFIALKATSAGAKTLNRFKENFFATKKLNAKIASGRFASAMALMLSSGLDMDCALEMIENLIDNKYINEKVAELKEKISMGDSFGETLMQSGIFGGVHAKMVSVGFKTGTADTVMAKLASLYEEEINLSISRMIGILEPTCVAVLSVIVGMILFSVMLPLMGIMTSIG